MDHEQEDRLKAAADQVVGLAEEVEASADASIGGSALESAQAKLHRWIEDAKGVVVNPAQGRVTLIHGDGRISTITSPDLPFLMSTPVGEWGSK